MYKKQNLADSGFLSILYSLENKPLETLLQNWQTKVHNGHVKRLTDPEVQFSVIEILGTNVNNNFIALPNNQTKSLGIKMPIFVLLIKNLKKYFSFQITVLDNKNIKRKFHSSNFQSTTRVKPFICSMPMKLDDDWNQIQFNLQDFCRRAFGSQYVQTVRVQVNANCRIARLYFNDRIYSQQQIPAEYKLFLRVQVYVNKHNKKPQQ